MTSATTKKSDRYQILMAVLLMSAFATALLILGTTRDRIGRFLCGYMDIGEICSNTPSANTVNASGELIDSQIISACVDTDGLKISVAFGAPLAHEDDVHRAAEAALELSRLAQTVESIEAFQIGIAQGEPGQL
jgi:hypothetical protein